MDNFELLLTGGFEMDEHFLNTPFHKNIPGYFKLLFVIFTFLKKLLWDYWEFGITIFGELKHIVFFLMINIYLDFLLIFNKQLFFFLLNKIII